MQRPPAQTSNPSGNTTTITAEPTRNSNRKQSSMATKQDWQRNPRRTGGSSNPSGNTAKLTAEPTRNSLWKQTGRLVRRPSPAEALLPQEAPQEAQKGSKRAKRHRKAPKGSAGQEFRTVQEAQKGFKRLSWPGGPAGGPLRTRRPTSYLLYTYYTLNIHL